jgi:hypothetical protein
LENLADLGSPLSKLPCVGPKFAVALLLLLPAWLLAWHGMAVVAWWLRPRAALLLPPPAAVRSDVHRGIASQPQPGGATAKWSKPRSAGMQNAVAPKPGGYKARPGKKRTCR